jgi:hypothetical protein
MHPVSETIFQGLCTEYKPGSFSNPTSFYFSLESVKKTIILGPEGCLIQDGKPAGEADCVCKMAPELFCKIWNDGYRPGMKEFLSGTIKSNNPGLLQDFLKAFGK